MNSYGRNYIAQHQPEKKSKYLREHSLEEFFDSIRFFEQIEELNVRGRFNSEAVFKQGVEAGVQRWVSFLMQPNLKDEWVDQAITNELLNATSINVISPRMVEIADPFKGLGL